jgi:hypothetical protein
MVRVDNNEVGYFYLWDQDKFERRFKQMRSLLEQFMTKGKMPDFKPDPFWSPVAPLLIGQAFLSLQMLSYVFENEAEVSILSNEQGETSRGKLSVGYHPCDSSGYGDPADSLIHEDQDPKHLIGKDLNFRVDIKGAKYLP